MRCLSRSIGVRLGGQLARIKKKLQKTQREITKRHLAQKPISAQLNQRQSWLQQQYQFIQTGLETYRSYIHQISTLVSKTKNPHLLEIYQKAWVQAHQQLLTHPFTRKLKKKEINQWRDWSTLMVSKFQRTTSAIEGRNGYLSRLHHSGCGLSEKDLQVLSVIHNFDLHRTDGSTAAQRFFGRTFPPLFSWVFDQMGDLPVSRKSRKLRNVNGLVA